MRHIQSDRDWTLLTTRQIFQIKRAWHTKMSARFIHVLNLLVGLINDRDSALRCPTDHITVCRGQRPHPVLLSESLNFFVILSKWEFFSHIYTRVDVY